MTPLNIVVMILAAWTAYTVFQRAEMMRVRLDPRPDLDRRTYHGNIWVIVSMDLAALAFAGWALELWLRPQPVTLGHLGVALSSATASTVLLVSMIAHNWREAARRKVCAAKAEDGQTVREVAEEVIPATVERSLEGVVDAFRQPAPPYDVIRRVETSGDEAGA
jgi:hypothetical protein